TPAGLTRLGAILLQIVLVAAVAQHASAEAMAVIQTTFLPARLFGWTRLGQPALTAFLAAGGALTVFVWFSSAGTSRAFLWAVAITFLSLRHGRSAPEATVELATAGLVLLVTVIESSFTMAYQDGLTGLPGRRALTE